GELSPFHETFGFYVDGVDLRTISLPDGWRDRVVIVDNANTNGFRGLCLEPGDIAASKLVAGRPKDLEYILVLLRERIVTTAILQQRLRLLSSLTTAEQVQLDERLQALAARAG